MARGLAEPHLGVFVGDASSVVFRCLKPLAHALSYRGNCVETCDEEASVSPLVTYEPSDQSLRL